MKEIEWGITRQVIFRQHDRIEWTKFPAIIKYMANRAVDRNNTHIVFELFSTIGWREETKFFQPYQIWLFDSFSSCHLLNPGYNTDTINHEGYWMNSFIEVVKEARQLLKAFDDHFIITDGRRVFATKITYKSQFKEVNHSRSASSNNSRLSSCIFGTTNLPFILKPLSSLTDQTACGS